jgi:hypothetical protein
MLQDSISESQYCLRWKQVVSTGVYHWHLRRLTADLQFWGYVHIRTTALSENRDFNGVFPPSIWSESSLLIKRIQTAGNTGISSTQTSDGKLLEGDAGTGRTVIECNSLDCTSSEGAQCFYELVNLLQPHVAKAAFL